MTKSTVMLYISFLDSSLSKKTKHNKIKAIKTHFSIWQTIDQNSLKIKYMKKSYHIDFFQIFLFFRVPFILNKSHKKIWWIWSMSTPAKSSLNIQKLSAKPQSLSKFRHSKWLCNYISNRNFSFFTEVNIKFLML